MMNLDGNILTLDRPIRDREAVVVTNLQADLFRVMPRHVRMAYKAPPFTELRDGRDPVRSLNEALHDVWKSVHRLPEGSYGREERIDLLLGLIEYEKKRRA